MDQLTEKLDLLKKLEKATQEHKRLLAKNERLLAEKAKLQEQETLCADVKKMQLLAIVGEEYRKALISETLALGVEAEGVHFDKASYEKMLNEPDRSLEDIKKWRASFSAQVCERSPTIRQTIPSALDLTSPAIQKSDLPDEAFRI